MNTPKNIDETIPADILSYLIKLGLSNKEAIVYFTLLKLGDTGTSKISKEAGLHSQFIYNSLDSLIEKGLVEKYSDKKRAKYSARDPKVFYEQIEKSKNVINLLNTSIENNLITTIDSNSIEVYKGKETVINNEMSITKDVQKGAELLIIGSSSDEYIDEFGPIFNEYEYLRNKKDISIRYIGSETQKKYLEESSEKRKLFNYRYLPGKYNGVMNISIYKNVSVTFYIFQNPISTIVIKNKKIIEGYIEFFETLWNISKK